MPTLLIFLLFLNGLQREIEAYLSDDITEINKACNKDNDMVLEGNLHQIRSFPWLGILKVHSHGHYKFQVGLTGVVLVKGNFALANAFDVAKISSDTLRHDSKVLFITDNDNPWEVNVKDIVIHPEYDALTYNTIAILELQLEDQESYMPSPICWPGTNFSTNDQLYLFGYIDDNQILEKSIYRLTYVDKSLCNEFYKRSKLLKGDISEPMNYHCAFGTNSKTNCSWENGRVVASNASGNWTLVGLLIEGPGCTVPARFLDTTAYLPWILNSMSLGDPDMDYPLPEERRSLGS